MSMKIESSHYQLERAIVNNWLLIRGRVMSLLRRVDFDLTLEHLLVLHILDEKDGRSLTELAHAAGRERTTISRMIESLEERRLVAIIPDMNDRRQKLVHLTDAGREKHESAHACCSRLREAAGQNISETEIETTLRILRKISYNLENERPVRG